MYPVVIIFYLEMALLWAYLHQHNTIVLSDNLSICQLFGNSCMLSGCQKLNSQYDFHLSRVIVVLQSVVRRSEKCARGAQLAQC